jgi:hypothetical protein
MAHIFQHHHGVHQHKWIVIDGEHAKRVDLCPEDGGGTAWFHLFVPIHWL